MQTEQTQRRQLLQELPDKGLLCLLMEIWLDMILQGYVVIQGFKMYVTENMKNTAKVRLLCFDS